MVVVDCPQCRGTGTVIVGIRGVCFAEFFQEDHDERAHFNRGGDGSPFPSADLRALRQEAQLGDTMINQPIRGAVIGVLISLPLWLLLVAAFMALRG